MIIHLVAGGPTSFLPHLQAYDGEDVCWIGVDRGVLALLDAGIMPKRAFGDFDSMDERELQQLKKKLPHIDIWPSEKDQTDTDIALDWALEQQATKIRVFGGTGGRLDHLFGNVQLLFKGKDGQIELIDRQNVVTLYRNGEHIVENEGDYSYISFIPMTPIRALTLRGFKYSLDAHDIPLGSTLCVSNELIHHFGTFSFTEGILMMIRSKDEK
ncbi:MULTISPECIES: thiamine diphosphokinase [Anoxybacillus]|uniref:Thiamine diphosphokinase n=1 Tax=Anoxybacillus tengchongensis TaxID=576944 RepID=A0A7W9YPA0_9BACL|nr:thiamine diphosphokinase [Anoxybacillus tengchongensis]MBB6175840.1 thiamine pyrophosphokinase [Anoxybacillus tengchongensis]